MDSPERVKHYLLRTGMTLATAESLTAGNVGARISSVSGSSAYFLGGVIVYTLDQKVAQLGVGREHAAACNCVSPQVAREMAAGCRQAWGADIAIATTGYAEPWFEEGEIIHHTHAYYAINLRGYILEGMVEGGEKHRVEMQGFVARRVLERMVHFFELLESGDMELSPEDTEKLRDLFFQLQKSKAGDLHE